MEKKTILAIASAFTTTFALIACGNDSILPVEGPHVFVLFDERHGLEGGEPVRMHDFEIGRVEEVGLDKGRVSVKVRLQKEAFEQLTAKTTFSVEDDDGTFLEAHVLDRDAPKLEEGARVEGADSRIELTLRRTVESVANSDWFDKVSGIIRDMRRELDEVEWRDHEEEIRQHWNETVRDMEKLAESTAEEAAETAKEVEEKAKKLADELEEIGKSEEARKIRERMKELLKDLGAR
jgi:paraquat-inducible protein B